MYNIKRFATIYLAEFFSNDLTVQCVMAHRLNQLYYESINKSQNL